VGQTNEFAAYKVTHVK